MIFSLVRLAFYRLILARYGDRLSRGPAVGLPLSLSCIAALDRLSIKYRRELAHCRLVTSQRNGKKVSPASGKKFNNG